MKIRCQINGLTHCKVADRLEQFLQTAQGRRMFLKPERENEADPLAVAAYMGVTKVGYVSKMTQREAWAGLRGTGKKALRGTVTAVSHDPCLLTFEAQVAQRGDVTEIYSPAEFEQWQYTGPCLPLSEDQETLEVAAYELLELIGDNAPDDETEEVLAAFIRLTRFDLSGEMNELRGRICEVLEQSAHPQWQSAARDLRRLGSQMGGEHLRCEMADYLLNTLPRSSGAQRMMARAAHVDVQQVRRELEQLPRGLFDDYLTDPLLFVSRLNYAHMPRPKLNQLLSGLVVLRLADGQAQATRPAAATTPTGFAQLVTRPELSAAVVQRLHELTAGQQKPRDVVMPIRAAMDAGMLKRPTWEQFCAEFGRDRISSKSSFSNYTNPDNTPYAGSSYDAMVGELRRLGQHISE